MRRPLLFFISLSLSLLITLPLSAEEQEGIMHEYRQVEEEMRGMMTSPGFRNRTLEQNLIRSIRGMLIRQHWENREEVLEGLEPGALAYEAPISPLIYYVRFKTYHFRVEYQRDPRLFAQSQIAIRMLDPEDMKLIYGITDENNDQGAAAE